MSRLFSSLFDRLLARRHGGLLVFLAAFVAVAQLSRLALLVQARHDVAWRIPGLAGAAAVGLIFDLGAALLWSIPLWLLFTLASARTFTGKLGRGVGHTLFFVVLYALLFGAVAEWLFWDEFGARFNFIAVDYLVYTTEVVANIREPYPLPWVFVGLTVAALAGHTLLARTGLLARWLAAPAEPWGRRWRGSLPWLAAIVLAGLALDERRIPDFADNYQRELAKDGLWSLFAAFRANELSYDQFYPNEPIDTAFATLRQELARDGSRLPAGPARDTLRMIQNPGTELHPNHHPDHGRKPERRLPRLLQPRVDAHAQPRRPRAAEPGLHQPLRHGHPHRPRHGGAHPLAAAHRRPLAREAARQREPLHARQRVAHPRLRHRVRVRRFRLLRQHELFLRPQRLPRGRPQRRREGRHHLRQRLGRLRRGSAPLVAARGRCRLRRRQAVPPVRDDDLQPPALHLPRRADRPAVEDRGPLRRRKIHRLCDRAVPPLRRDETLVQGHPLRDRRRSLRLLGRPDRTAGPEVPHPDADLRSGWPDRPWPHRHADEPDRLRAHPARPAPLELPEPVLRPGCPPHRPNAGPRAHRKLPEARAPHRRPPRRAQTRARGNDLRRRSRHIRPRSGARRRAVARLRGRRVPDRQLPLQTPRLHPAHGRGVGHARIRPPSTAAAAKTGGGHG